MKILLLTLGTRGDIQPYVALGRVLRQRGHEVTMCASEGFRTFIEGHGLGYAYMNNDVIELVNSEQGRRAMGSSRGFRGTVRWMLEAPKVFKKLFARTLRDEWAAAQGAEGIVYNPGAVGGFH